MFKSINFDHYLNTIYLVLDENQIISVGKLGVLPFKKGVYIYVGSAKRNIKQRINRHIKIRKKIY
jgi:Uri superfamily endonuclease